MGIGKVIAGAGAGLLASQFLTPFNPFDTLPLMFMGGAAGALFSMNERQVNQAYDPRMLNYQNMQSYGGFQMPPGLMNSTVPMDGGGGWSKFMKGAAVVGGLSLLAPILMGGMFSYPGYGMGMPFMGMGGSPFGWMAQTAGAYATMPWLYGNGTGSIGMFGQSLGMGGFDWGVGLWR